MTALTPQPILRAAVYRLLSQLWGEELSQRTVESLNDPDVRNMWMILGGSDPRQLASQLDHLAEDYCRLFVGPVGHLPPIQSVWTVGELQSSVVGQLTEFSRICNYNSSWPELLPDHLANELQLMAVMLQKTTMESEQTKAELANSLTTAFFNQHLAWTSRLVRQIQTNDANGFYGHLAALTQSFLDEEAANLAAPTDVPLASMDSNS